jgi:hypothetical protein
MMGDHSIFGEAEGAGRRDRPARGTEAKRPNPLQGLFGARARPDEPRRSAGHKPYHKKPESLSAARARR